MSIAGLGTTDIPDAFVMPFLVSLADRGMVLGGRTNKTAALKAALQKPDSRPYAPLLPPQMTVCTLPPWPSQCNKEACFLFITALKASWES